MTSKTSLLAAIASSLLLTISPTRAQDAAPSTALEGTWEGSEVGRETTGKWTMKVTGNTLRFDSSTGKEWYTATFTLVSDQTPKQLQATVTGCPEPTFVGKQAFSIFKIEDGTLTLTGHHPGHPTAPKDFNDEPSSRTFVLRKAPTAK